ncbi:putative Cell cycle and apoptosis regulator protein [Helianthus annuus]|nr:putative Cell cycle and apoptosis regulator protein [Helianthus annuus]KAJ0740546.1 putative Cell cycle and apoptosis regulator protein [Helianthus annuus]
MYSSRGSNAYGQQQQQQSNSLSYSGQNLGTDGASQLSMASRHSALLGSRSSAGAHYGGQYTSVYGSTAHDSVLQVSELFDQ